MRVPIQSVTPDAGHAEICGWVHEERDLGGLAFFLIRDRTGIIQVTIPKKKAATLNNMKIFSFLFIQRFKLG